MKKKLPKSIRKHIRVEKARIRREVVGTREQEKLIRELRARFLPGEARLGPERAVRKEEGPEEETSKKGGLKTNKRAKKLVKRTTTKKIAGARKIPAKKTAKNFRQEKNNLPRF